MRRFVALSRLPNGRRLLAGSLLVAPGQAAVDLVILLALRQAAGSFGPGGLAVAAGTIAFSVSTLVQGRMIDRFGIRRVIATAALALAAATTALAVAVELGGAPALLIGLSALVGLSQPAAGPAARTAWKAVATDQDSRIAAFSYCSVSQDVGFVVGTALFGFIATATTPSISLACCGVLTVTGAIAISSARTTPSRSGPVVPARLHDLLRATGTLLLVMLAIGVTLGAVDVSATAFASQHAQPGLAGVLVAACSFGSLVGGLAYGARSWNAPAGYRLLPCTAALTGALLLPALAPTTTAAAIGLLVAGAPMGASLTTGYLLAAELVPEDRTALGFSLLTLTLNIGAGVGYAFAGRIAGLGSATDGFLVGVGAALLGAFAAAILAIGYGKLARLSEPQPGDAS
jgi:MFS family permease